MSAWRRLAPALAALLCGCGAASPPTDRIVVRETTPGFLRDRVATDVAVAGDAHGRVALTYVTLDPSGRNAWIALSRDSGITFAAPRRLNDPPGLVHSSANSRPVAAFGPGGALAVAWIEREAPGDPPARLLVRASGDGGQSFGAPAAVVVPAEGIASPERASPTLAFVPDGSLFAAWNELADPSAADAPAALRSAVSADGGLTWGRFASVSDSACRCCGPTARCDRWGRVALAHRTHRARAPALAVSLDGGRTFVRDTAIAAAGAGSAPCPADAPDLVWSHGQGGHYAWTDASAPAGAHLVTWRIEYGAAGVQRPLDYDGRWAGHPVLAGFGDATLVAVESRDPADPARPLIAVRTLEPDGRLTPWQRLGAAPEGTALCGFDTPAAIACWTDRDAGHPRVRVVRLERRRQG